MQISEIKENLNAEIDKLRSKDGYLYAGYPNFNTLFGRDSLISAWQMLPVDANIAQNTLKILAKYQATDTDPKKESEPGKILHEYRLTRKAQKEAPDWGWPYYGSVDSTLLFLIVAHEYWKETKDTKLIQDLWPNIENAVKWLLDNTQNSPQGFVTYKKKNPKGLLHQGWKDSNIFVSPQPVAVIEAQGYAYKACNSFVELSSTLNKKSNEVLVNSAEAAAEKIKENLPKYFYNKKEDYFAIGLNSKLEPNNSVTSNPGHLLLCDDVLNKSDAAKIKKRLFKPDMFTKGGIRTLSSKDKQFDPFEYHMGSIWPHDNWFIYLGMKAWGFEKEAEKIKNALIRAYGTFGYIPELFAVIEEDGNEEIVSFRYIDTMPKHHPHAIPNPQQAWAVGTILNMLAE